MSQSLRLARPSETQEQIALFAWRDTVVPREPRLALLYASANGGARPAKLVPDRATGGVKRISVAGKMLKAMGVTPGIPDLCLPWPMAGRGRYTIDAGLYIELKKSGLTPRQAWAACSAEEQWWLEALAQGGYQATVCSGWTQAARMLCTYLRVPQLAAPLW
jgi:hypothetical protein